MSGLMELRRTGVWVCGVVICVLLSGLMGSEVARGAFGVAPGSYTAAVSDIQAGAHADMTVSLALNSHPGPTPVFFPSVPDGNVKDIDVRLPAGLTGNPRAYQQCSAADLALNVCPADTQVGVARYALAGPPVFANINAPIYNLIPQTGHPADFGFHNPIFANAQVHFLSSLRTGEDYGINVTVPHVPGNLRLLSSSATIWGVPADPSHDGERGACLTPFGPTGELCASNAAARPLLSNPTQCGVAQSISLTVDAWEQPGVFLAPLLGEEQQMTGCDRLTFGPSLSSVAGTQQGASPTGYTIDVGVPQSEAPAGLATPQVKRIVLRLPQGVAVNPSSAGGLGACTPAQIGLDDAGPASCPESSKIGTVEAQAPAVEGPVPGSIYLASQGDNPFGSLLALYVVLDDPQHGILIKVAGEGELDPFTGQITAVFDQLPQQPFSSLKVRLKSGPRAPLVTPDACGSYGSTSQVTSWDEALPPVEMENTLQVTSAAGGAPCGPAGFSPSFTAGTVNPQAGAFSPFMLSFSRQDGEQALQGVQQTLAPGLSAKLAGVPLCSDGDAVAGTCAAGSQIGTVTVGAGAGPNPFFLSGKIFLTGAYNGGAFGEVVVVHAAAGPFDLGNVVVRGSIRIDPHTAQATVVSDPFPTILQGIPVALRRVDVALDRPGFTFNPTNCEPLSIGGTLSSAQGATANVSSHFQAANCAALAFHPSFKVSTKARTSKAGGASLDVKVTSAAGQANLGKVAVSLPKQLPSRLTTIQQACTAAVFNQNPASCPAGSNIGIATARTPILANPVTGPVYLVSHGGAAFPDLVMILQGEGVTTQVVGSIDIKGGVTSSAFNSIPDIPIGSFELSLPQGPHSALGSNLPAKAKGSLCGQSLVMPTTLTGQNGARVKQSTKIAVSGCPKAKKAKKKHKSTEKKHKKGGK